MKPRQESTGPTASPSPVHVGTDSGVTVRAEAEVGREEASRARSPRGLMLLVVAASLAGLCTGLIGALFGLALEHANRLRDALVARTEAWGAGGFVLCVALAAGAAALAAWLVRRIAPAASGSGIPRVIAVLEGA